LYDPDFLNGIQMVGRYPGDMQKRQENQGFQAVLKGEEKDDQTAVYLPRQYLLKCRKASKIKGFRVSEMRYYTITTPISNWNLGVTTKKRSKYSEERG